MEEIPCTVLYIEIDVSVGCEYSWWMKGICLIGSRGPILLSLHSWSGPKQNRGRLAGIWNLGHTIGNPWAEISGVLVTVRRCNSAKPSGTALWFQYISFHVSQVFRLRMRLKHCACVECQRSTFIMASSSGEKFHNALHYPLKRLGKSEKPLKEAQYKAIKNWVFCSVPAICVPSVFDLCPSKCTRWRSVRLQHLQWSMFFGWWNSAIEYNFFPQRRFAGWRIISGKITGNEMVFQKPIQYGHFWIWLDSLFPTTGQGKKWRDCA